MNLQITADLSIEMLRFYQTIHKNRLLTFNNPRIPSSINREANGSYTTKSQEPVSAISAAGHLQFLEH